MGVKAGRGPRGDVLQGELDDAIVAASFDKMTSGGLSPEKPGFTRRTLA